MRALEASPLVSIVVTTKNEQAHLWNCLRSIELQDYSNWEICVVDNFSCDRTVDIALSFTDKVALLGPERSAQRNFGLTELADGEILGFIDADMILGPGVVRSAVHALLDEVVGMYVDEIVLGDSRLARTRRFERSFYSGTVIDCARFFTRDAFIRTGGFDESLTGPEDWDFDKRLRSIGTVRLPNPQDDENLATWELHEFCRTRGVDLQAGSAIVHNENELHLIDYLRKKAMYGRSMNDYTSKWGRNDPDVRRQLGAYYRLLGVFIERRGLIRCLQHPVLFLQMISLRMLSGLAIMRNF